MRQFDAYQNPSTASRESAPYLIVLSSHHLRGLDEVIVAPAVNDAIQTVSEVEIAVEVEGAPVTLVISELFSISSTLLKRRVGSLADHEDAIRRALDRLFTGF